MMGRNKQKKRIDTSGGDSPLTSSPFAGLSGLGRDLPQVTEPREEEAGKQEPDPPAAKPRRAVVRFSRKGRGGKEVTLVQKLDLSSADLDRWLCQLKRALGCGGTREDHQLVFQGDQRGRLPALLEARGVRRISVS